MKNFWLDKKDIRKDNQLLEVFATWDFQTALGDTIKEKYESIYVKVVKIESTTPKEVTCFKDDIINVSR
jgi:hypothetical protein